MIIQGNVIELDYKNPLAPPRALAVSYWETEIGKTSNGVPSYEEIAAALVNPNPGIRTRASRYLELTPLNYKRANLCKTNSSDELRKAEWIAVGLKSITFSADSHFPMLSNEQIAWLMSPFTNNLAQIDPDLALLFSMALAPEKNDPSLMDCVAGHKFTEAEIAVIKPDVYRIARQSKLVRDKLIKMKFDAPELSPEVLHELENTNLFKLVP
jgi:hypothetical protein